ncbi:MAG: tRNA (cytidine(34)-2'-O)-methyltransferase [Alphaproteobacteria bacterium]
MEIPAKQRLRLALYQPDMPQNTGAMMRLAACFGVALDIIEPCGFPWDEQKLKRTGLDYIQHANYTRHQDWQAFQATRQKRRLVLLTTKSNQPYYSFDFRPDDILMVGRESAGVPEAIHQSVDAAITVPMQKDTRSLNVGMAAAIVLSEALRQTQSFP